MTPLQRARIARNMDYHQQLADHYTKQIEPREEPAEGEEQQQAAQPELSERELADAEILADMHADAAQQLRDVLGEVEDPVIEQAMANRPVVRDATPIRTIH